MLQPAGGGAWPPPPTRTSWRWPLPRGRWPARLAWALVAVAAVLLVQHASGPDGRNFRGLFDVQRRYPLLPRPARDAGPAAAPQPRERRRPGARQSDVPGDPALLPEWTDDAVRSWLQPSGATLRL